MEFFQAIIELYFSAAFVPFLTMYTLIGTAWLKKRKYFWLRLAIGVAVFAVGGYFLWSYAKTTERAVICVIDIAIMVALCVFVWILYDCSVFDAIFYTVFGCTLQHLGNSAVLLIARVGNFDPVGMYFKPHSVEYFLLSFGMDIVMITLDVLAMRFLFKSAIISVEKKKLIIPAVLILIVFSVLTVYVSVSLEGFVQIKILDIICCVANLTVMYSIFETDHYRNEIKVMNQLEKQRHDQYEMSRETIDVINTKCHDLKKLVRSMLGGADMKSDMTDIEKQLNIYDSIVKTGNDTLDLVLTEKSLYCDSKHIKLGVMADGEALGDMSKLDIYSMFCNILDNAIEAVMGLAEDKRYVSLAVRRNGNMVSVHSDNYFCGGGERTERGLIRTTKQDETAHGYGLLSIKRVAEKYGGTVKIDTDDDVFNIDIIMNI